MAEDDIENRKRESEDCGCWGQHDPGILSRLSSLSFYVLGSSSSKLYQVFALRQIQLKECRFFYGPEENDFSLLFQNLRNKIMQSLEPKKKMRLKRRKKPNLILWE